MRADSWVAAFLAAALAPLGMPANAAAQSLDRPRLETNEAYVTEVTRATALEIGDPMAVFGFVLESLPDRVRVYPTENFYYFRFIHNGVRYAGNIRLDPLDRDSGKVHFVCYPDLAEWGRSDIQGIGVILDAQQQVMVDRVEPLQYRVSFRGRTVVFLLNDLSLARPPSDILGPDEKFLGPIFDESAIRFFLIFNTKLKIFHYLLDEMTSVVEELVPAKGNDRILIGQRTGFAFYADHRIDRKILIGVFEGNRRVNNEFDGPFDQLPENFIEGEALREAIIDSDPAMKDRINRLGHYLDRSGRYAINPYMHYYTEDDLRIFHRCAISRNVAAPDYHRCFDESAAR